MIDVSFWPIFLMPPHQNHCIGDLQRVFILIYSLSPILSGVVHKPLPRHVEGNDGVRFRPDKVAQPVRGGVDKAVANHLAIFIPNSIVSLVVIER